MERKYLCIDLKSFYASVECVERGLDPFKTDLIVADPSRCIGAITLAITPKMKERGIKNRCRVYEIPKEINYIVAKPRMKKYIEYSAKIYGIYLKYFCKEDIHVYSIDEVFIDITPYLNLYNKDSVGLAKLILKDIYIETGITATAGIGTNLFLAKVALDIISKHVKTNIGYLDEDLFKEKLWHHTPLTDFWQIGVGTANRLKKYNITTMFDIANYNELELFREFGINARYLIDHSKGIEPCSISDIKKYKSKSNSISQSQILYEDYEYYDAKKVLIEMIDSLVGELVLRNKQTRKVSVYIGYSKDIIPSLKYSVNLGTNTCSYRKILHEVITKYNNLINKNYPIRRIAISFSDIIETNYKQTDIFGNYINELDDLAINYAVNDIKKRYGKNILYRGISYTPKATQITRNKLIGGHNAE